MSLKILLVGVIIALVGANVSAEDWKYELKLDQNGDYHVFWNWDQVNITIEVQVRTKGYVGFGFSPKGGMKGADIVTGWVKDSQVFFQDRYATENAEPVIDESQDYELLAGYENETHTVLRFRRKLDTCDDHDIVTTNDTMRFIYAWGDEDPKAETGLEYHGSLNRGTRAVKLTYSRPNANIFNFTDDVYVWDLKMPKVNIAPTDTTNVCEYFVFPAYPYKHHRVAWEIIVDPTNAHLVHHVVLSHCDQVFIEKYEADPKYFGNQCSTNCLETVVASAVGKLGTVMPPEIGALFGDVGKPTYLMANVHYNNPGHLKGVVDQTTIRIYLTEKLRKYESGSMSFILDRVDLTVIIPPKQPSFIATMSCPSECTKQIFPEGAHVFSYVFHGHLTLRKGRLRHFRDGIELPYLFEENNFDFEHQEPTELPKPVRILAGDYIMGECEYDTTGRENLTLGGVQNVDEMCVIYWDYYPASNVTDCNKYGPTENLYKIFQVDKLPESVRIRKENAIINAELYEYLTHYNASTLTEDDISNIINIQLYDDAQLYCHSLNGKTFQYTISYPNSTTVFYEPPPKEICKNSN